MDTPDRIVDVLAMPVVPDFLAHLESDIHRELSAAIHDWSRCPTLLTKWEDEHLLDVSTLPPRA